MAHMNLVIPAREHLEGYIAALKAGWSPNTMRLAAAQEELARIAQDADEVLRLKEDRNAEGPPVVLSDGSLAKRLPGYTRWLWDGEFCGMINFRWQRGTTELPPHVLGHIGYSVVPWKQRRGYATEALRQLLFEVRQEHLPYVELTTDVDNIASQRVMLSNGAYFVRRFRESQASEREVLLYRIDL